MKAQVKFSLDTISQEIDLEYYGYTSEQDWDSLSEFQQNEIEDSLREENVILVSVKGVDD